MDVSNKSWIMKNPALHFGLVFFLIFGGQFVIRYIRDNDFYILHFIFGVLGLLAIIISLVIKPMDKKKTEEHLSSIIRCSSWCLERPLC